MHQNYKHAFIQNNFSSNFIGIIAIFTFINVYSTSHKVRPISNVKSIFIHNLAQAKKNVADLNINASISIRNSDFFSPSNTLSVLKFFNRICLS